jgi:hypothetical protein
MSPDAETSLVQRFASWPRWQSCEPNARFAKPRRGPAIRRSWTPLRRTARDAEYRLARLRNAVEALSAHEKKAKKREQCAEWETEIADLEARVAAIAQEVSSGYHELAGKLAELLRRVVAVNKEIAQINVRARYESMRGLNTVHEILKIDQRAFEQIKLPVLVTNGTSAEDIWPPPQPNVAVQYSQMVLAMCQGNPMDTRDYQQRLADDERRKADETARVLAFYEEQERGRERLNAEAAARARAAAAEGRANGG